MNSQNNIYIQLNNCIDISMTWNEIDLNSIIIIVMAICIGIIKVIEMYKSGSYRNTKLNNSKEEMKQVEAIRNKYREKFKNNIKDIKKDMIKEIKNNKFDNEFDNSMNQMNNILERLIELYNNTNQLISTSNSTNSENSENNNINSNSTNNNSTSEDTPINVVDMNKLIELKNIDNHKSRIQSIKEEFADTPLRVVDLKKVKNDIINKLNEHNDIEIDIENNK